MIIDFVFVMHFRMTDNDGGHQFDLEDIAIKAFLVHEKHPRLFKGLAGEVHSGLSLERLTRFKVRAKEVVARVCQGAPSASGNFRNASCVVATIVARRIARSAPRRTPR